MTWGWMGLEAMVQVKRDAWRWRQAAGPQCCRSKIAGVIRPLATRMTTWHFRVVS